MIFIGKSLNDGKHNAVREAQRDTNPHGYLGEYSKEKRKRRSGKRYMEDKEKKEKNMQNRKRVKGEREKENEGEKYDQTGKEKYMMWDERNCFIFLTSFIHF